MTRVALGLILAAMALAAPAGAGPLHAARTQSTKLISRSVTGGVPNGPSTHPVISADRRFARFIAFQSTASNLVHGDSNGHEDVFLIERAGSFGDTGSPWTPGRTILVSRGLHGKPANGRSFAPAVDGSFRTAPRCVAFLSSASNLVHHDTNGKVDAFLWRSGRIVRISYPGGHQAHSASTAVGVSGDCSRTAFVAGGHLFTRASGHTHRLSTAPHPADPSFAVGESNDLVFGASASVYLSRGGTSRPSRVAKGSNPVFNRIDRQVIAYQRTHAGHVQIAFRELGHGEQFASSSSSGQLGNGDSTNPTIANSGFYIAYQSESTNLGSQAHPEGYLYTDVRKRSDPRSVDNSDNPLPGGARDPAVSYLANYFLFSSPAPLGARKGPDQVWMRYLGGI